LGAAAEDEELAAMDSSATVQSIEAATEIDEATKRLQSLAV
jgi:hypothetical protein